MAAAGSFINTIYAFGKMLDELALVVVRKAQFGAVGRVDKTVGISIPGRKVY